MKACATVSGGVMFIPENIQRKALTALNDNQDKKDEKKAN